MAFDSGLHPRGPDGRFTRSFTRALTDSERAASNRQLDGFKAEKLPTRAATQAYFKKHKARLTPAQRGAVDSYTGDGFLTTNKALRAGDPPGTDVQRLDSAMSPLPTDLMLNRTVYKDAFGNVDPESLAGSVISDAGYSSTSVGPDTYGGVGAVRMHIVAPAGTPSVLVSGFSRNQDENEVLLARGTTMAVARVVKDQYGGYDMYMIVLPDHVVAAA